MTDWNGFKGAAKRLDDIDLPREGRAIGIGEDLLHAFLDTETQGKGFDVQDRPIILFEPHVFYRNLAGAKRDKAVAAGLAYVKQGTKPYGKQSEQYPKLVKAMAIDETAALMAVSMGLFQVLGENHKMVGYATPQAMMRAMMADEENHLRACIEFTVAAGIDDDLRELDAILKTRDVTATECVPVVRVYNGSGYAKNDYHTKFAAAANKWRKIKDTPYAPNDDTIVVDPYAGVYDGKVHEVVRNVQQRLDDLGYHEVGTIDGKWGTKTAAAVLAFRNDNALPTDAKIDDTLLAAMLKASPRKVDETRATTSIDDLKKAAAAGETGAQDVKVMDLQQKVALATGGLGALGVATKAVDELGKYSELISTAAGYLDPIKALIINNIGVVLLGVGGFGAWQAYQLLQIRLQKHRTAQDVSV